MYIVILLLGARKELERLPRQDQERIGSTIDTLAQDPFSGKKLRGDFLGAWSIRVWPYRVIYKIEKQVVKVTVLKIGHRKDVYR